MCNDWEYELDRLRMDEELYQDFLYDESLRQEEEDIIAAQIFAMREAKRIKEEWPVLDDFKNLTSLLVYINGALELEEEDND